MAAVRCRLAAGQLRAERLPLIAASKAKEPVSPTGSFFVCPMSLVRSFRAKYFLSHLALSAALVGCAAGLILVLWYPGVLSRIDGVLPIVGMLVLVDVCLGPLLTLVVASPKKPRRELWRDLAVIGAVQGAALVYGVHSAYVGRPVFVVFDVKQFETVSAKELDYTGIRVLAGSATNVDFADRRATVGLRGAAGRSGRTAEDHGGDSERRARVQEPAETVPALAA